MFQSNYDTMYNSFSKDVKQITARLAEEAGNTINRIANAAGSEGAQALFDAVMDAGNREVLVKALNSPSLPGWVREQLEVFLYGSQKQIPALFMAAPRRDLH
jgi:hypothetical protein